MKNKITWINLLHLYQPPYAETHQVKEATVLSYWRIIRALEENKRLKFTLNISGCLLERWDETGELEIIRRIKKLLEKRRIEITGTAAFHPLLPLIPEEEAIKQIKINEKILKKYFGKKFQPRGFFFPEMAYSQKAGALIKKLGYGWTMLDEIAYNGRLDSVDFNKIYKDRSGLKIIFRNRRLSGKYIPDELKEKLKGKKDLLYITATDGELYGLRHVDQTGEFEKIIKEKNLKTLTVSEFLKNKNPKKIAPLASSWETSEKEIKNKEPFNLWSDKNNKIQKDIWQLANFALKTVNHYHKDENYVWARRHLMRGLASCVFWWASGRQIGGWKTSSWGPDEIERGAKELIKSIRSLSSPESRREKQEAEKIFSRIIKNTWKKHWKKIWKK